jgi:hypothetical protein
VIPPMMRGRVHPAGTQEAMNTPPVANAV